MIETILKTYTRCLHELGRNQSFIHILELTKYGTIFQFKIEIIQNHALPKSTGKIMHRREGEMKSFMHTKSLQTCIKHSRYSLTLTRYTLVLKLVLKITSYPSCINGAAIFGITLKKC